MGQDQSKAEELFRPNPKFQRTGSKEHNSNANAQYHNGLNETSSRTDAAECLTRSEISDSRGHKSHNVNTQYKVTGLNEPSPRTDVFLNLTRSERTDSRGHGSHNAQYEVTGLNETSPRTSAAASLTRSERNIGIQSIPNHINKSHLQPKSVISTDSQLSYISNVREENYQKFNVQSNSLNVNKNNLEISMSPSPKKTLADNPKSDQIQNSEQINSMIELGASPKRQTQQVQNENLPSKTNFSNIKFQTPERDVRHVPTCNEQIRLNSTVTGNPFLSTPNTKSEYLINESVRQLNYSQSSVSNEMEKYRVKEKLEHMYCSGILSRNDLDECAFEALESLPVDLALFILNQFTLINPKTNSNKSAYLCSMIKDRIGDNELKELIRKKKESLSANSKMNLSLSSQNNSTMNFVFKNTTSDNFANTIRRVSEEDEKETNPVSFPVSLSPKEVTGDNDSSTKDQCPSGNISVKNTMTTTASTTGIIEPLKEDILKNVQPKNLFSYKVNVARRSKQSPSNISVKQTIRQRRLAPRLQKQFKRNLLKGVGLRCHTDKTSTHNARKDIERLVESLSAFKKCSDTNDKTLNKENNVENISGVDLKDKRLTPSFEECITQMRNIKLEPKENLILLQKKLCSNLEIISNFMSVLNTFPYMDSDEIVSQVNKLKKVVMLCPVDVYCSSLNPNTCTLVSPSEVSVNETNYTNPGIKQSKSNIFLTPSSVTVEKTELTECSTSNSASARLNSFKVLLDELPHEYESEKKMISLNENNLFCTICDKFLAFNLLSLINHFKSIDHQKNLNVLNSLPKQVEFSKELLFETNETKENTPETKTNNEDKFTLGKNHQSVLEMVYTSCKYNFVHKTFYICVPCDDFYTSENDVAMNHVEFDKMHINQQIKNAKWHTCNTCDIVIYATESNFHDHCLSVLHCDIMEVKQKSLTHKDLSNTDEKEEDRDDASVCSSKGDPCHVHKKPHEILLIIAKDKKNKENFNGIIGLFCHVCNRYFRYDKLKPDASRSERHIREHAKINGRKNYKMFRCLTCNVELFGDKGLWLKHQSMELHKELAYTGGDTNPFDHMTESNIDPRVSIGSQELPIKEGPHFDLMKAILKNHLKNESSEGVFGYYCHLCQTSSLEEKQWQNHVISASHINRINSSECVNRKMWHNCRVCNILLICNEHIFILHEQSLGHEAVSKLHQSRSDQRRAGLSQVTKIENDEEVSDNESEDTEDESEDEEDDDSHSTTSSKNANNANTTTIVTGIKISGLPPGVEQRELFETFKKFGYIKICKVHRSGKSGTIKFANSEGVKSVLEEKDLYIRRQKIYVFPSKIRGRRGGKRVVKEMNASAIEILQSKEKLNKLLSGLKAEIAEISRQRPDRSKQITQDILKVVPGCKVYIFGSQFTGLALRDSDCDIYIDHDGCSYSTELSPRQQETIIYELLKQFTVPTCGFRVCETVMEARVPILRVVHEGTNIPCDISCRSGLSMENSILTRQLLSSDFRVSCLVIIIKWWMNANDLLGKNKFTSYTTTWLVLFFLMHVQPRILSSVMDMKENCPPKSIGFWDCRFNHDFKPSKHFQKSNCDSRYKLLVDFFKFYGTFNFRNIVLCPLTASVIPRKTFEGLKVPPAYNLYVQKIRTLPDAERLRTATPICLQDPFDLSHNIAKGVSHNDLNNFKRFCTTSYKICENHWGAV